jgi:DNA-directed RNA polymerase sigma subunit (sigma70/sigma32)
MMLSLRRRLERLERQVFGEAASGALSADDAEAVQLVEMMEQIRQSQLFLRSPDRFDARNRAIVQARQDGWTLEEIAGALAMSRERIRAVVVKAERAPRGG